MRPRIWVVWVMVALFAHINVLGQAGPVNVPSASTDETLAALQNAFAAEHVVRIEIIQLPPRILTRTRVTPESLEATFHYKFVIRDIRSNAYGEELVRALKSTTVQPSEESADVRWGLAFYDGADKKISSVYFDRTGANGFVDSTSVSFKGGLFRWVDSRFARSFR